MKTSEEMVEISKAMNAMQAELHTVSKDAKGYNYKYANFASIWNALREPLTKNGLSIIQDASSCPEGVSVVTRLQHVSGQWIEFGPLLVPMGKKDAHSTGSAISYARRYALSAAVGIVPDDDDGALAQKSMQRQDPEVDEKQVAEKALAERQITAAELELLEIYLQNNDELRAKILHVIKERFKIESLQYMPYKAYVQALQSAKNQYQETLEEKEEVAQ